jgi:hypothetical protein
VEVAAAAAGLEADLEAVGQYLEDPQDLVQATHLAALDELPLLAEHAEGDTLRVNIQTDVNIRHLLKSKNVRVSAPNSTLPD